MSEKQRAAQYADARGSITMAFDRTDLIMEGPTVPPDGTANYHEGALFFKRGGAAGAQLYINEGTNLSCDFNPVQTPTISFLVAGLAAGYKLARGQLTTVTAADTVVTGLATVVSVVAVFEDDVDGVTISQVTAQVGNQSGAPAAGSIIIKTWKATSNANPTLIAATTFSKKVNWVAIGT